MPPVRYELGFYIPEDGILHRGDWRLESDALNVLEARFGCTELLEARVGCTERIGGSSRMH
jgi:hypothetical protein